MNDYAHKPEKIANRVYANKYGNDDEDSGDGFKYHGRGLIQLTFKANYQEFAADAKMELDEVVDYVATPEGAVHSACWFWDSKNINEDADAGNCNSATHKINGGTNGLAERKQLYKEALGVF